MRITLGSWKYNRAFLLKLTCIVIAIFIASYFGVKGLWYFVSIAAAALVAQLICFCLERRSPST